MVSLASAALTAAEAHAQECAQFSIIVPCCSCLLARRPGHLIFSPEWRPTPRIRGHHPQPAGPAHPQHRTLPQVDAVAILRNRNQDVYDQILNHPFPKALGNGTASLDGFRYFMVVGHLFSICNTSSFTIE